MMKTKLSSFFSMLKPTKRKLAVLVSVAAICGLMVGFMAPGGQGGARGGAAQSDSIRTVTLTSGDMASTVSATGTVYSTNSVEVYSNLSYPIKTVYVEVGDTIQEGDMLAELNTSSLESDISQKQASVWASQQSAQQSLSTAQQDLNTYQKNVENNYDTNLLSAESSVATAELEYQSADLDVQSASNDVHTARRNLQEARYGTGAYEETGEATDGELNTLRDTLISKETALEKAQTNLEKAQANLEKAQASLAATQESTSDTIATYENKVKSAEINTNLNDQYIAIQKLQADLEDCTILSPASGTVTAVNAVVGGSGSGLLFVIQDTDSLKVVTNIKEYDIDTVSIGDKVTIKADATGDTEFSGTLSKIAPTSTLTTSGTTTSSTDAEFESEVTVDPGSQGLRIGMNTRLSIVTEEKTNIFSVPYEAVETDPDGSTHVYVMTTGEDGAASYTKLAVQTGMENNLYVEISGDELRDGLEIVRSAGNVPQGEGAQPNAAPDDARPQEASGGADGQPTPETEEAAQ